ncbi:MAG: hypothetical protein ABFS02_05420, partial [Pseudomonadota bacterium]
HPDVRRVEIPEDKNLTKDDDSQTMPDAETSGQMLGEEDFAGSGSDAPTDIDSSSGSAGPAVIEENRSFDDIYTAAGIAESPFSADKLLKLLDALGNLPEDTRKQAVIAMDAAEESWTIEDPLLDAQRRIQALENERGRLGDQADRAESEAAKALQAQTQYEQEAVAQIRRQIADLEALMEREVRSVAESRERIKAQSKSTREACRREQSRLERELGRLQQIEKMFTVDTSDTNPHNNHQSGKRNG